VCVWVDEIKSARNSVGNAEMCVILSPQRKSAGAERANVCAAHRKTQFLLLLVASSGGFLSRHDIFIAVNGLAKVCLNNIPSSQEIVY
jgi:hypothetical protein